MENENFPKYYTILSNGVTDAIKALDRLALNQAREILVRSQQEAEEAYISEGES